MTTSDRARIIPVSRPFAALAESPFSSEQPSARTAPTPRTTGDTMQQQGRPTRRETRARTRRLLELCAQGVPLHEAAEQAHVKPERVLRLLDDAAFFAVYQAVRTGDLPTIAAVVHMPPLDDGLQAA